MNETAPSPSPDGIVLALREMQAHGDEDSFVVVLVGPPERSYSAQFAAAGDVIYSEMVHNQFLPDELQIPRKSEQQLRRRSWRVEDDANWTKTWHGVTTDDERRRVVLEVLETLREVYDARSDLQVYAHLIGVSDEAAAALAEQGIAASPKAPTTACLGFLFIAAGLVLMVLAFLLM